MKAVVVKNDEFETIGFEVSISDKTLFQWGVSPINTLNWQKEIDANYYMVTIFRLVELRGRITEQEEFINKFFQVARNHNFIKEGQSVNFKEYDEELKRNKDMMINIIKSFK